jgi:hypothetical protein
MTCRNHLLVVYRAYATRTGIRVSLVERGMSRSAQVTRLSDDERRNESATYAALFSDVCRFLLEDLYQEAVRNMRGKPFGECEDALNALSFLQEVTSTALWRHRLVVGETLTKFAREFDRLDLRSERERLHARAQGEGYW